MSTKSTEIPRIEAAERQLDAAIKMWLTGGDTLAVHTIAMASYGLLNDLASARDAQFRRHSNEQIRSTMGHNAFHRVANQLKHGDRDPNSPLNVPCNQFNESIIGGALVAFRVITEDLSELMGAFHLMMLLAHSEKFSFSEDDDPDVEDIAQYMGSLMREDVSLRRTVVEQHLKLGSEPIKPLVFGLSH